MSRFNIKRGYQEVNKTRKKNVCVYLDSQVIQVVSQYVSSSCDCSLSFVVL